MIAFIFEHIRVDQRGLATASGADEADACFTQGVGHLTILLLCLLVCGVCWKRAVWVTVSVCV